MHLKNVVMAKNGKELAPFDKKTKVEHYSKKGTPY